jgi:hypothetical protein
MQPGAVAHQALYARVLVPTYRVDDAGSMSFSFNLDVSSHHMWTVHALFDLVYTVAVI